MKTYITIILITFLTCFTQAQKLDWEKAPLNPIAFKYKLEHFNVKNVFAYNDKFFKDGQLMYDNAKSVQQYYKYNDDGVLIEDSKEHTYIFNAEGQLISITSSKFDKDFFPINQKFEYDSKGRLIVKNDIARNEKTYYTYNDAGQIQSQTLKHNGLDRDIIIFTYSKENKLLKIKKQIKYITKNEVIEEELFFDRGILVKKIDFRGQETIWKTKTDAQGNYLQETDVTYNRKDLSNNLNFSYKEGNHDSFFGSTYLGTVFINDKPAPFMPVFSVGYRKIFFDLFNQDYYNIQIKPNSKNEFEISILAKNKEAIAIKPKNYNPYHPIDKVYQLIYAGIIRNQGGLLYAYSHLNVHEADYKSLIVYDRFFEKNYYLKIDETNGLYILDEALPVMFYVTEAKEQKLYHFVVNGIEINPARLNLSYANNNEDASVMVDNKLTYYIKGLKNLENRTVYYPTVL
jgi:hypothetical protein